MIDVWSGMHVLRIGDKATIKTERMDVLGDSLAVVSGETRSAVGSAHKYVIADWPEETDVVRLLDTRLYLEGEVKRKMERDANTR